MSKQEPWFWRDSSKQTVVIEHDLPPRRDKKISFRTILIAVPIALIAIFIFISLISGSNPVSASIQAVSSVSEHVSSSWDSLRDGCSDAIDKLGSSIDDFLGKR